MKKIMTYNKLRLFFLGTASLFMLCLSSCELDEVPNKNAPTLESFINGASLDDLRLLATGLESVLRFDMEFHYWTVSILGREYYDLRGTDPRYTGELLGAGAGAGSLDNNGFLTTRAFARHYKIVRNADNLIIATENSRAGLSDAQKRGLYGYAKTLKAYGLLSEAIRQFENGIRLDTRDPDNLGPFTSSYQQSLEGILAILDDAENDLANAGNTFAFFLSSGFNGFNTPGTFLTFNRALYARVMLYAGRSKADIITQLNKSFMDLNGSMNTGVYHVFGTTGNDIRNPLFNTPNVTLYTVHPSFRADAEANDQRVANKTTPLDPNLVTLPVVLDGLSGDVQVTIWDSPLDPVGIIRNEELILIYAEAQIGVDNVVAAQALNAVRNAAGLPNYPGPGDDASLLNEVIKQRRYSLFGEGHRWVDMRRFNRLGELPLDRPGDEVFDRFPRPILEL